MPCIHSLVFSTLLLISIQISAHAQQWTVSGLGGGGGIEQPTISPHNNQQIYLSSDMSGVYRSDNFGRNWTMLPYRTNGQAGLTDRGRGSPVQFTSNPGVLYATHRDTYPAQIPNTDAGHIRYAVKSTDGGRSFQRFPNGPAISKQIYADPRSTQRVIINTTQQILYSRDGGQNFAPVSGIAPLNGVLLIAGVFWDANDVFVATNRGLFTANGLQSQQLRFVRVGAVLTPAQSIATFSGAKDPASGAIRFFAVTYTNASFGSAPGSLWNLNYPRNPEQLPGVGGIDNSSGVPVDKRVRVYRMNWVRGSSSNRWQNLPYPESQFIPFWIRTARNNVNTVYIAGLDRQPWIRPGVMRHTGGGLGLNGWTSVFKTDGCQGLTCPNGTGGVAVNVNIATGWFGSDGDYGDGAELDWGWGPNAEGLAVDPNNANRVVLTTNNVHVTENGGRSWRQAYGHPGDTNPAGRPTPPHNDDKRYRSNGIEPTMCWSLHWTGNGNMLAGMTDIYGMLSEDSGKSWRSLANTLPHGNTYRIVASKTPGVSRLYAATSTINDIYLAHSRITNFENNPSNRIVAPDDCLTDDPNKTVGSVSDSRDNGESWEIVQRFKCPVVWVETVRNDPNRLYVGVVHGQRGGIYTVSNLRSANPVFYPFLYRGPGNTAGNPNNIYELDNGDLLTSWSVKVGNNNRLEGSGIYRWRNSQQQWLRPEQPPAMATWTRDVTVDPHNQSIWYAAAFNRYSRFSGRSNTVADGGGGIFRFTGNGASYQRITPASIYRAHSLSVDPRNPDIAYVASANDGLWETTNLRAPNPSFRRVRSFPYGSPLRIFFAPDNSVWVTSFGGGLWQLKRNTVTQAAIERVWVPINESTANNIIDANNESLWVNNGSSATSGFTLYTRGRYRISRIRYKDPFSRDLSVTVNQTRVFRGWTNTTGNNGYYNIVPSTAISGCAINFYHFGNWIAPSDVEIYGVRDGDCQ